MSNWIKQPVIQGGPMVCTICGGGAHELLDMRKVIAVGFGSSFAMRDGDEVYNEQNVKDEKYWNAGRVERMATKDPDHDWRITFVGPLWGGTYQRQGDKHWVLIEKDEGFA